MKSWAVWSFWLHVFLILALRMFFWDHDEVWSWGSIVGCPKFLHQSEPWELAHPWWSFENVVPKSPNRWKSVLEIQQWQLFIIGKIWKNHVLTLLGPCSGNSGPWIVPTLTRVSRGGKRLMMELRGRWSTRGWQFFPLQKKAVLWDEKRRVGVVHWLRWFEFLLMLNQIGWFATFDDWVLKLFAGRCPTPEISVEIFRSDQAAGKIQLQLMLPGR